MSLHINDVPASAFVDGHKHFRGIIVPVAIEGQAAFARIPGQEVGRCAVCEKGTVYRIGPRQACDHCGSPAAHHPDPEALLREKGLEEFIR